MVGTYISAIAILAASAALGQAVFAACGRREWSWLSPAVGLARSAALAGARSTSRLRRGPDVLVSRARARLDRCRASRLPRRAATRGPRDGRRRRAGRRSLLASLPFLVERRFGILGTSLNPDMSQHLFAADRLANGGAERLIARATRWDRTSSSVVLANAAGPASSRPSAGSRWRSRSRVPGGARDPRAARSLAAGRRGSARRARLHDRLVPDPGGVQGDDAGAIRARVRDRAAQLAADRLGGTATRRAGGSGEGCRSPPSRSAPCTRTASRGSLDPGRTRAVGDLGDRACPPVPIARGGPPAVGAHNVRRRVIRALLPPAVVAFGVLAIAIAPELGRMADFAEFETFDPDGAGLGNLFNPISPLEALGIWPSGDFRLDPGAGFAPSIAFWAGALLGLIALGFGLRWWISRGERAVPAALAAGGLLYLYATGRRHALPGGEGDRDRGAARDAGDAIRAPDAEARLRARRCGRRDRAEGSQPARSRSASCPRRPAVACWRSPTGRSGLTDWSPALTEMREARLGMTARMATTWSAPEGCLVDERGRPTSWTGGCVGAAGVM